jgi:hypothetical protein
MSWPEAVSNLGVAFAVAAVVIAFFYALTKW